MNKITCNVIKDILPLYIDGVVSEDTQKIVDEHLAECSLCRDEMNKLKKTLVIPTIYQYHTPLSMYWKKVFLLLKEL